MPPFNLFPPGKRDHPVLAPVSRSYPSLTGRLPTCYSPVRRSFHKRPPEGFSLLPALDLHVLGTPRSEEHTSELQSRENLVCRLLLEKKKTEKYAIVRKER